MDHDETACEGGSAVHDDHNLMSELHALFGRTGMSRAAIYRRIELRGFTVGRSTLYDLLKTDASTRPEWETIEPFVITCLGILDRSKLPAYWTQLPWWRELYDRESPLRAVVRIGRIPPLADCFQLRDEATRIMTRAGCEVAGAQVVSGMGGVGKTQLAAYATWRAIAQRSAELVVWVDASSRSAVIERYRVAATALGIDTSTLTPEAAADCFLNLLATTGQRWLIVLDDLADPNDLRGLWPPASGTGHTLATTRRADTVLTEQGRVLVDMKVYSHDQATHYLEAKLADVPELADDIQGVVEDLGRLPIALSHAVAFIKNKQLPCGAYRTRFAAKKLSLVFPARPDSLPDEYERTVTATLWLAVEAANALSPAGLALPLLSLASVCDGTAIPRDMFSSGAACNWISCTTDTAVTPFAQPIPAGSVQQALDDYAEIAADGLHCLRLLSLAELDSEVVIVHPIVRALTRERVRERLSDVAWAAGDALHQVWPDIDSRYGSTLRANADAISAFLDPSDPPHLIRRRAARSRCQAGDPVGAVQKLTELIADQTRVLGADHVDTLRSRTERAMANKLAGNTTGAIAELEQVVPRQLAILGATDDDTWVTRGALASVRGEHGDARRAIAELESLLAELSEVVPRDHLEVLRLRHNLAYQYAEIGRLDSAMEEFVAVLADLRRQFGADHTDTLNVRHNLAYWRGKAGDYDGARREFEELLADRTRILGSEHPDVLRTRNHIAILTGAARVTNAAIGQLEQLARDQVRILGPDHPDTLTTRHNLARELGEAGDNDRAVRELESLLADYIRVFGTDNVESLRTRHNLAFRLSRIGEYEKALAEFDLLVPQQSTLLGPEDPRTLVSRHERARALAGCGDRETAIDELTRVVAALTRVQGADNTRTLLARSTLATLRAYSDRGDAAMEEMDTVVDDVVRVLGPDHPDTKATRSGHEAAKIDARLEKVRRADGGDPAAAIADLEALLAESYALGDNRTLTRSILIELIDQCLSSRDVAAARGYVESLIDIDTRTLGPSDRSVFVSRANLALIRSEGGDMSGAIAEYTVLMDEMSAVLGELDPDTIQVHTAMADLSTRNGDQAKAVGVLERLLARQQLAAGPDHPAVLDTRERIARQHIANGDTALAVESLEQLAVDCRRILGPEHRNTYRARNMLAVQHRENGHLAQAVDELEQLVADQQLMLGHDHPDTFAPRTNLAMCRQESGDSQGAVSDLEHLLTSQIRTLPTDHPMTINTRDAMTRLYIGSQDFERAVAQLDILLPAKRQRLGPQHPDTLETHLILLGVRLHFNQPEDIAVQFRSLIVDLRRSLASDDYRIQLADEMLAIAEQRQQTTDEPQA